jgi:hypothetical protein
MTKTTPGVPAPAAAPAQAGFAHISEIVDPAAYSTPLKHALYMCMASSDASSVAHFHLDSGASYHCSPVRSDFQSFTNIPHRAIQGISGSCIYATGKGNICVTLSSGRHFVISEVYYVPQASMHLLSIGRLCDSGYAVTISPTQCLLSPTSGDK